MRKSISFLLFLSALGLSVGSLRAQGSLPDWNLAFTQPAVARLSMNMAFDSGRQVIVMFGGRDPSLTTTFSDTYEYTPTAWRKVATPHSPPARFWAGMAYDAQLKRMVLFGGLNSSSNGTNLNDTWEYDGNDWTNIQTVHSPPAQSSLSMTYDTCRQKTVVLSTQGDTWEYDGIDWTQVATSNTPPVRNLAAMVFDPGRCRTILFGGLPAQGPMDGLSDTWEYDGSNWTQIDTPTSPPGRWGHVMAFDTDRSQTVLFGGYGPSYPTGQETNDTWEYDGATWVQELPQVSPRPAGQRAMVYDPTRARGVIFGGWAGNPGEAWEYFALNPGCSYYLAPTGQSFTASSGMGAFTVNTGANCGWVPVPSSSWITIMPGSSKGTGRVNYAVSTNTGSTRNGTISAGGKTYSISQAGYGCSYSIGPTSASPGDIGGNLSVSVSAANGCSWSAVSNVPWLTVKSGASGSGGGMVVLTVAPNTGGPRSGTATIAGQTFSVTQGAGACGALDVTSQTTVTKGGLNYIPFSTYLYSQTITVKNTSGAAIPGPVFLVTIGEPTHNGFPNDSGLLGGGSTTSCFSSPGDYLILVSGGSLAPGQAVGIPEVWFTQSLGGFISYSMKVLSGPPAH